MSTLRISNIEAKSVPASATVDEKVKITNSSGDTLVFIDGKTSGITTVGINTTDPNITFDANSNIVVTGVITATRFSGQITPTSLEIGSNIKLGNAGVITATSFVGSGANLTSLPSQITFNNAAADRILTSNGGTAVNGEENLTFNGQTLTAHMTTADPAVFVGDSNRTGAGQHLAEYRGYWDGNQVGRIVFAAGTDTTNKDDGIITMHTTPSGGGITERLRIASDGKVKIGGGTASLALLHIAPADYSLNLQNNSNNKSMILFAKNGIPNDSRSWIEGNGELNGYVAIGAGDNERLRITSTGDANIIDGDLVVASGHGINFSATSDAPFGSTTNRQELLDDYEEGQWVPVYSATTNAGSVSYSYRKGYYIKIGAQVTVWIEMTISSSSGMQGDAQISNLPFNKNDLGGNGANGSGTYYYSGTTNWYIQYHSNGKPIFTGWMPNNSNVIRIYNGDHWGSIASAPINTNGRMSFSYTYTSSA